jgi:hypothetical protein
LIRRQEQQAMHATSVAVILAPLAALVLGSIAVGGGLYETLLVDRVWPGNLVLIQPGRGGINRGLFWMPVQMSYELALVAAAWETWDIIEARWWAIAALAFHLVARAWSFAYFIPNALRFEKLASLGEEDMRKARRWTRLSRFRPVLEMAAVVAQAIAILKLAF